MSFEHRIIPRDPSEEKTSVEDLMSKNFSYEDNLDRAYRDRSSALRHLIADNLLQDYRAREIFEQLKNNCNSEKAKGKTLEGLISTADVSRGGETLVSERVLQIGGLPIKKQDFSPFRISLLNDLEYNATPNELLEQFIARRDSYPDYPIDKIAKFLKNSTSTNQNQSFLPFIGIGQTDVHIEGLFNRGNFSGQVFFIGGYLLSPKLYRFQKRTLTARYIQHAIRNIKRS